MRQPASCVQAYYRRPRSLLFPRLISLPGSPCVPVRFYRARSESGIVRAEFCGRARVSSCLGVILLLKIQIAQEEVEISTGGRQLVGGVQMFLGCTEIT